jgi:multisubunit Na+/H+ antiporter MnhF subunit
MSTTLPSTPTGVPVPPNTAIVPRRAKAIQIWAWIGAGWLAVLVWEWGSSLVRGRLTPNHIGGEAMPEWMNWSLTIAETLYWIAGLSAFYFLFWKPFRRDRVVTFDGALVIGFFVMWATTDSWATYLRPLYIYNSGAFNLGCPQCQIPGALGTNWSTQYVEPIGLLGLYAGGLTAGTMVACALMRKAQARWPRIGKIELALLMLPVMVVFDMLFEIPMMAAGWWSYANAIPGLTLFEGHYYQYPLYEGFFMYLMWCGWSMVRHFRNDRGETVIERGLDSLRVSRGRKNLLRILAVIGMIDTVAVVAYHLPLQFVTIHSHDFPPDVLSRPYFLHGECGPGTDQACAGTGIPIATSATGAHATPDGRLVAPGGLQIQLPPYGRTTPTR